ncbi:hypothetical protein MMC19_001750 [Ptychographa xylographoides]|nr:hypothetical protein [Ptychographa xylographoides]
MNTLSSSAARPAPRTSLFQNSNPFASLPPVTTTPSPAYNTSPRPSRSASSSSTGSFRSTFSTFNQPATLAEVLASSSTSTTAPYGFFQRNPSFVGSSRTGSLSGSTSRRSSCFSILEAEEEKAEFGPVVSMLEPRPGMGWWGLREVLEEEEMGSRRGSLA